MVLIVYVIAFYPRNFDFTALRGITASGGGSAITNMFEVFLQD